MGRIGPEDRRRLVSLREGRPHAASRSEVVQSVIAEVAQGVRHRAAHASPTRRSCGGCCSPRSTRPARSWKRARRYRASDIDVMWLHGFGFPRYRGGLMFWADTIGSKEIYEQIVRWHNELGPRWRPSALLKEVAGEGRQAVRDRDDGVKTPSSPRSACEPRRRLISVALRGEVRFRATSVHKKTLTIDALCRDSSTRRETSAR